MATIYRQVYESLGEMCALADTRAPRLGSQERVSRATNDPAWAGTPTFAAALTLARNGWTEGRDKLFKASADAGLAPKQRRTLMRDMGGIMPCVPSYLAGDPMHMMRPEFAPRQQIRVVKMLAHIFYSSGCQKESIMNRGAAILSAINALEANGHSVELTVTSFSSGRYGEDAIIAQDCTVKHAGDVLDIDTMAFVLLHPSMFRRIIFSLNESAPGPSESTIQSWYGHQGFPAEVSDVPADTLYFPVLSLSEDPHYRTPESARRYVQDSVHKFLGDSSLTWC